MTSLVAASALSPRLLHGVSDDADPHMRIDGTAVVVDISGFTTLSEQLAAAGREGTEQLIATLSRVFTVLLPVTDDGGDVVKFAGDALFILFTGTDHAKHAVHAAWNMNRVLATIGDIHLSSARAKLRMSVGVHSGTFEVLLTGDDHVSAILTGAATSRVLELQNAAAAGRILVSDQTAAALPVRQVAAEEGVPGAHRLLRAGSVATASLMALSVGRTEAADRFLPRAFAERHDLLGAEPDHRWAAIAFVQVSGVPDEPGPADLERMSRLTGLVEAAAADTGATLLDVDPSVGGYRYFLTAGAPTTAQDPEGRLVTAALRIVAAGGGDGYTLRAGVTSGRVFAGFVGATYRQTYTVMGDPTNLAARLAARAGAGTVLVARSALERTGRPFETEDAGTISVKGKTQQIPVAIVTGRGGATVLERQQVPFVGRTEELSRLRSALADAAAEVGSVLTVTGPAGIGKTRLIDHALAETPLRVLRAHGDRYGANTPYRTLQSLLRPLLDIPASATAADAGAMLARAIAQGMPALVPWLPLLAPAFDAAVPDTPEVSAIDDAFRAERTSLVLVEFITASTTDPGVLVIDDAQWVDPASQAVLEVVIAADASHAIVLLRRDEARGVPPLGESIALGGLDDVAIRDIIEAVAGRRLLPADARPIISRSGGNPLFAIELATGLAAGERSLGDDALGIEQLVGERIDALPDAERATLRRAAVLGIRVPLGLYLRCVGAPLISGGLGAFLELGPDSVSFRSELFRDVAYGQLSFQVRRELHRAAAAAIESDPMLGGPSRALMLAAHYEAAGEWEAAHEAARQAAEMAAQAFALEEAVRAYRVAVEAAKRAGDSDQLADLLEALGRVSVAGGWAKEGLDAFSAARKLISDTVSRARLDRERAYALNVLGRQDEAVQALRTARRALTGTGEEGRAILAAIDVTEAGLRLRQARWSDARRLAQDAAALLDGHTADDTETRVLADALRYGDIASGELEGDTAMVNLPRALELYDRARDELSKSKVLNVLGARAYYRGDWTTAAVLYGQAGEAAQAAGDVVGAAIETANAAEILVDQGRFAEAQPLIDDALRVFEASDNPYLVAFVTGFIGRAALRRGDPDAARAAFLSSAEGFESLGEHDAAIDARVRLAEAALDAGDVLAAAETLGALSEPDGVGPSVSRLLRQRARLAAAAGDTAAAGALALEALDAAASTPFERALSLVLISQLSPEDGALALEAEAILRGLGLADVDLIVPHSPTPSPRETPR
ncbi:AAA family ATPase [Microbacterium pumilum]|uniref:Adenylate/guanylate cyclase domain-containing protein n=1 Tax=Microbacterium pumilum TaxID=344165 RepID=A0ABN2RUY6_9MICO